MNLPVRLCCNKDCNHGSTRSGRAADGESLYGNKGIGPVCGPSLYAMFRAVWFNLHVLFGTKMIALFLGANGVLHVCKTSGTV